MENEIPDTPTHCVAVIGGAVAGAEVAGHLAEHGVISVVIEQNPRPYGKIEDGLPRWHHALREKEYASIREKLSRPGVHFLPSTKVGRDVDFAELIESWGFSAVVLACGAWRDRPLPIEGADEYVGAGLVYQNPFVIWFNHAEESHYEGPVFDTPDGSIVVGGGLASIDVAKILMLENTRSKLAERGIEIDLIELEVKGIPKTLKAHGLEYEDLGLEGCTIYYRRGMDDMPLVSPPDDPQQRTPERMEKVKKSRRRLLEKAMEKYRFALEPYAAPDTLVVEGDRLVGLGFRRTRVEGGRVIPTDETFERRGSCVISAIGSIPEPIPGIDMKGELYNFSDWDRGRLDAFPTVFSVGNVVTGKGNLAASRKHASHIAEDALEIFLGIDDGEGVDETVVNAASERARKAARQIARELDDCEPLSPALVGKLLQRVHERQRAVGYTEALDAWLEKVAPA
jgi:NADPH-dependent glutamate synthase beta subunit-like oxidoreductase